MIEPVAPAALKAHRAATWKCLTESNLQSGTLWYLWAVDVWESFEIIGSIRRIEAIATGEGIHDLIYLEEHFGPANWRKLKGLGIVKLEDGTMHEAEIHWYEADGIGMQWAKIKRFLE